MRVSVLALVAALAVVPEALRAADVPARDDLLALQFYLETDDRRAVDAEVARLQSVFPAWTPPTNLGTLFRRDADLGGMIDRIFADIADRRFDSARAGIAEAREAFPEWTPPDDMTGLLRVSEAQLALDRAHLARDTASAIRIARSEPGLLTCERVNNAWILADAYAATGETAQAQTVHRAILDRCADPALLTATIEKAEPTISAASLSEMIDIAIRQAPAQRAAFHALEDRLRAGRGLDSRWGTQLASAPATAPQPAATGAVVTGARGAPAVSLRPVARGTVQQAVAVPAATPRPAPAVQPAASVPQQAAVSDTLMRAVRAGAWSRCLELTRGVRTPAVVAQRGWCAYNADRPLEALNAFHDARGRMASGSDEARDTGYGTLLAMLKLGQTDQAARDAARVPLTLEQRIEVEGQILDRRGVAAYEAGEYRRAIAFIEEHRRVTGLLRRDLELIRGYSLLNLGQREEAATVFQTLHDQLATPATAQALRAVR